MDIQSSKHLKAHLNAAVEELSSALLLVRDACSPDEFLATRKAIGEIIAAIDATLHDSVYIAHPELNDLASGNKFRRDEESSSS